MQNSAMRLLSVLDRLKHTSSFGDNLVEIILGQSVDFLDADDVAPKQFEAIRELQKMYQCLLRDMENSNLSKMEFHRMLIKLRALPDFVYATHISAPSRSFMPEERQALLTLAEYFGDESLDSSHAEELTKSFQELYENANAADIDPELKKILAEVARIGLDAIRRYEIHGADGLAEAFKRMLAETSVYYFHATEEEREEVKKTVAWASYEKALNLFDKTVSAIKKTVPLIEHAAKALGS